MPAMYIVHPDGRVWDHFTDEPHLKLSDLVMRVRHVGEGNDGNVFDPKIVKVTHYKSPMNGKTYMEIFIDASKVTVKP